MRLNRYEQTKAALGGSLSIGAIGEWGADEARRLYESLWLAIFKFEKRFSRFIESSEISFINRRAGLETPISEEMLAFLTRARSASEATEGLYNPFILPALQRSGYLKSAVAEYSNDDAPDYTSRLVFSPSDLELSKARVTIPHHSALDAGGIGKGYLADQIGQMLREYDAAGYWIDVSGDIATFGRDENGEHFRVAIQDTDDFIICPDMQLGVATSGTRIRHDAEKNGLSHHIIDPRTGKSAATDISLATVIADDTTTADILASCAIIVGADDAPKWLRAHGANAWRLLTKSGIIQSSASFIHSQIQKEVHA